MGKVWWLNSKHLTMKFIVLSCFIFAVNARPQEFASPDEVELIEPVRDDGVDGVEAGDGPIVLIVRGGVPSLPRIPGFGNFFDSVPGFSDFPLASSGPKIPFGLGGLGGIDGLLGPAEAEVGGEDGPVCGPLCQMFRVIQGLQGEIDEINRTVLADTDEDGNQFFSHTSVVHNFGDDTAEEEEEEVAVEEEQEPTDDEVEMVDVIPESDPTINEINDAAVSEEFPDAEFGVDEGLQQ